MRKKGGEKKSKGKKRKKKTKKREGDGFMGLEERGY